MHGKGKTPVLLRSRDFLAPAAAGVRSSTFTVRRGGPAGIGQGARYAPLLALRPGDQQVITGGHDQLLADAQQELAAVHEAEH